MPKLAQVATARQAQLKDGRRLGFAEFGDPAGEPVLIFHDLWGNRMLRHPDDSLLTRLGVRLIGVDRPGYGMSARKPGRSLMDVVDDVMLLSKALKLERFSVLGYSAGGPYALACAYRFPEIVRRCAIVSSMPPLDNPKGFEAVRSFYGFMLKMAAEREHFFRGLLRALFIVDAQRDSAQYMRELAATLSRADQEVFGNLDFFSLRRAMWQEIRDNGSDAAADEFLCLVKAWGFHLQSIRVPVDIWWGEADNFCSPVIGRRMAELILNSRLRMEAASGHLVLFTHWQAILEQLIAG